MGDGCRRSRVVGLAYGPPGTRKTASAEQYAQWSLFKPFLPEPLLTFSGRNALDGLSPSRPLAFFSAPLDVPLQECRTVFSTPPVSASAARIEKEVLISFAAVSYLVEAANQLHQRTDAFLVTRRFSRHMVLFIVNEANRLKDAGLEVLRDSADRGKFGLVLLGMPGLQKRLMRAPQLSSSSLRCVSQQRFSFLHVLDGPPRTDRREGIPSLLADHSARQDSDQGTHWMEPVALGLTSALAPNAIASLGTSKRHRAPTASAQSWICTRGFFAVLREIFSG
jgi:hypothetical protein